MGSSWIIRVGPKFKKLSLLRKSREKLYTEEKTHGRGRGNMEAEIGVMRL